MQIKYTLQGTRGVVDKTAPLIIEANAEVEFVFEGSKNGLRYVLKLNGNHYELVGNTARIGRYRLKKGTVNLELLELTQMGEVIWRYMLTPLSIVSVLDQINDRLVVYPETDEIMERLLIAEKTIEEQKTIISELTDICAEHTAALDKLWTATEMARGNLEQINKHIEDPLGGR